MMNLKSVLDRLEKILPVYRYSRADLEDNPWAVRMWHTSTANCGFWVSFHNAKLSVSGIFPERYAPKGDKTVRLSLAKSDEQIERDLNKRFFPWYFEQLIIAQKKHAERTAFKAERDKAMKAVETVTGCAVFNRPDLDANDDIPIHDHLWVKTYRPNRDGSTMNIVLSDIPTERALKVFALLKAEMADYHTPLADYIDIE
jgi:hypothetical protein